jgi:hypothetical protein
MSDIITPTPDPVPADPAVVDPVAATPEPADAQIGVPIDLTVDNPDHPVDIVDVTPAQVAETAKGEVVNVTDGEGNTLVIEYGDGRVTTVPVYEDGVDYSVPAPGFAQKPLYLD